MQQQIPQQEQYGTPQQVTQPMMLCPIQYVYDSQMIVPQQAQDQQIRQSQIVFNVQNPPPWIQHRPPNQVVYVHQVPGNYQPYMQQQMVQAPLYQHVNYIQQPMIAPETRQFVQMSNVAPYNNVQSQTQIAAQQVNNDTERMPILTQMLNQKMIATNVRVPQNANNMTAGVVNVRPPNTYNIRATGATMIRPVMQNQQVQTEMTAAIRGRQRNLQPQIISINPMQHNQYLNQKPEVLINMNARPRVPYVPEVPQHIRNKVPSSISVKTLYRPIHPRTIIRPYEVMPSPQNVYYHPSYVTMPSPDVRNNTNTDNSYLNQNNQVQMPSAEVNVPVTDNTTAMDNQNENNEALQTNSVPTSNANVSITNIEHIKSDNNEINTTPNTVNKQTEEKLIRNTVYVQARGRVLNENDIHSLKRTIDDKAEGVDNTLANNQHSSNNKYKKVETKEISTETDSIPFKRSATRAAQDFNSQPIKIINLPIVSKTENCNKLELDTIKPHLSVSSQKSESTNPTQDLKKKIAANILKAQEKNCVPITRVGDVENKTVKNDEIILKSSKLKGNDVTILTHVLDGYIIQESNVAFPIQRPTTEKENTIQDTSKGEINYKMESLNKTSDKVETTLNNIGSNVDLKGPTEVADNNKDNPFADIPKSTIESWTYGQLASHLSKHDWKETAAKLHEQEIDGESMLLVKREHLLNIGICERHAETIAAFVSAN